jgi:hypothetical protein
MAAMMSNGHLEAAVTALRRLTRKSDVLQGSALTNRLSRETKLDAASIRTLLKEMRAQGWIEASSWSATGNPVGRVKISLPALPAPLWVEQWNSALLACSRLSEIDREVLFECGSNLADMDSAEYPKILEGLVRLREDQAGLFGTPEFLVSAQYLCASSKMLSKLGARAVRAFGIDLSQFPDHPLYVVTAGTRNPKAVVLVENPAAFELAAKTSAVEHCAFIATFGFGLSKVSEDYGNQLACMVEEGLSKSITLMREGSSSPPASELLAHPSITFWGDLDIAGMQIYERIAKHIPALKLSALYLPMIEAATKGNKRHRYVSAAGKSGQSMFAAMRDDSKAMLEHCREWAVDQELVAECEIERLAGRLLNISSTSPVEQTSGGIRRGVHLVRDLPANADAIHANALDDAPALGKA